MASKLMKIACPKCSKRFWQADGTGECPECFPQEVKETPAPEVKPKKKQKVKEEDISDVTTARYTGD
jgi:uncharacterized Zn finger protein (UPF0148 family)